MTRQEGRRRRMTCTRDVRSWDIVDCLDIFVKLFYHVYTISLEDGERKDFASVERGVGKRRQEQEQDTRQTVIIPQPCMLCHDTRNLGLGPEGRGQ